jgi:cation transport regulator ChaC
MSGRSPPSADALSRSSAYPLRAVSGTPQISGPSGSQMDAFAKEANMLVFQYGSNCLESEINGQERLRGDAKCVGIGRVDGFQLAFDVWSTNRGCAASDIIEKAGEVVWGVLYEIPDYLISRETEKRKSRKSLDAIEGEGNNYERRTINVCRTNGDIVTALTYTVRSPRAGLKTNITYVRHIVSGLRERGIGDDYIGSVKAIATTNNPEIAAEIALL